MWSACLLMTRVVLMSIRSQTSILQPMRKSRHLLLAQQALDLCEVIINVIMTTAQVEPYSLGLLT